MNSANLEPSGEETAAIQAAPLERCTTGDGSPSLWSRHFGQAFHCRSGALQEARRKFIAPAQLERFAAGSSLVVVEICVGLGYNTAALIEAAEDHHLQLQWWGLEIDPRPLALALSEPGFRCLWRPQTLTRLQQLQGLGWWCEPGVGEGCWRLGDARRNLPLLATELARGIGRGCDLVFHDAFSPSCCPELWTMEFLDGLAALLAPGGRLITYSAAAAVRRTLQLAGLELASLIAAPAAAGQWSAGTAASPTALPAVAGLLQPLSPMEREHLSTRAAEPYRDPDGRGSCEAIQAARRRAQARSSAAATSAWRRRWLLAEGSDQAR